MVLDIETQCVSTDYGAFNQGIHAKFTKGHIIGAIPTNFINNGFCFFCFVQILMKHKWPAYGNLFNFPVG